MNDYRCFIWDFDGTLYDTYGRIVDAVKLAMDDLGLSYEGADVLALTKTTLRHASEALAGERSEELLRRYFAYERAAGMDTMQPFPGCVEALRAVVGNGGFNYLYTHRDQTALDALRRDGLEGYFRDFITDEADFPSKPAPDALNWLIDQHRLERRECVIIGDRRIDVQAGRAAGIATALFDPQGFYGPGEADFLFKKLEDIPLMLMQGE
ncbi:MAG: HAD hydrolase-like protein [Clostridiales bacterium]|nr:HAD hydrolase-like protein [Clostridiales bacterium]